METLGVDPPRGPLVWPLVGRENELDSVASAQLKLGCCGVVFEGPAGVGKTRLAREVLALAVADGAWGEWIQATRTAASIPLGAFAALLPPRTESSEPTRRPGFLAESLRERSSARRLVLAVDDAQLLDSASAALVLDTASSGAGFVVATVRTGERCPDAIVALWRDSGALRVTLRHLSEVETGALLAAALGGEIEPGASRWAFAASEGNALYLRELVSGALSSGALASESGRWRLRWQPTATAALADLISIRLRGLGDHELDALRLLAFGEPLADDILARVCEPGALAKLEVRGIAVVGPAALEREARLVHPLYGEVVRASTPSLRASAIRVRLADAVRAGGLDVSGAALRVTTWLEEAGATIETPLLLAAAREANSAGAADLAERFIARAGADGGIEGSFILAQAHTLQRRWDEAEELLAGLEGRLATRALALEYLEERAVQVLHLGLLRSEDALRVVARADAWYSDESWRDQVELVRLHLNARNPGLGPSKVIETVERLIERDALIPEIRRAALAAYAISLYAVGRSADAHAVSAQFRPILPLRDDADSYAFAAWWVVRVEAGYEWTESEQWLTAQAQLAGMRGGDDLTRGEVACALTCFAMRAGRPTTATRWAREAIDALAEGRDPSRRIALVWLALIVSSAMRGDVDATRNAYRSYRASVAGAPVPYMRVQEALAEGALAVVEGDSSRAARLLLDAATENEGRLIEQGHLLYDAMRAGAPPSAVAARLQASATGTQAPLMTAFARHAAALATADGAELSLVAETLGEIGASLWAAEAAAQAAMIFASEGRGDSSRRAIALSARYREHCEDAVSPVLASVLTAPAGLTRREREIANLAANGASSAEIATRLTISVRTVESHLYKAMQKLGVSTRRELRPPK